MLKLLIVDDCPTARLVLTGTLRHLGKCDEAGDGEEAVRLFKAAMKTAEPYDVVFMDIMMPGMDGMQAAREIAGVQDEAGVDRGCRSRMIMVSCLSDSRHVTSAQYEFDADYFIPKPIEQQLLLEALINLDLLDNPLDQETPDADVAHGAHDGGAASE